ncbi:MAG: multidrug effflux MFS transporter [Alphaproteobacteria bacterium]|nr:multidrug effflux MFS transporter [Alphaproteobacteria bacterium]
MPDTSSSSRPPAPVKRLHIAEFVAMTASLMAMNALAIDIMLPALSDISASYSLENPNDRQLVIVVYMLGFGVSQLVWGPLTDRFGRRPILWFTLLGYSIGGLGCVFAPDFGFLLAARTLQGVMAGASRVIAMAAARDIYSGRRMAQVMSLVMMTFMAAPILAPSIGQFILFFAGWHAIFWVLVVFGLIMLVWCGLRLPETLPPDRRTPLNVSSILKSYGTVFRTRDTLGYMIASGLIFGGLFSFISSSEQVFREVYDTGTAFPLWFAGVAVAMSAANLLNSRFVISLGMRRISHGALLGFIVVSALHVLLAAQGLAPFPVFYALLLAAFFAIGLQGPNYNAIMMEPLGRLAGSGSAVSGFVTSFGSGLIGGAIARTFDGSTTPIFIGHLLLGLGALLAILITERGRLMRPQTLD